MPRRSMSLTDWMGAHRLQKARSSCSVVSAGTPRSMRLRQPSGSGARSSLGLDLDLDLGLGFSPSAPSSEASSSL